MDHGGLGPSAAPRSPLGERLVPIRERIIASGVPLLSWKDIEHEIVDRRGGAEHRG